MISMAQNLIWTVFYKHTISGQKYPKSAKVLCKEEPIIKESTEVAKNDSNKT